jgi:hypothetical protein
MAQGIRDNTGIGTMRLSQTRADKLKSPGRYSDGDNLYLQVTKAGSRSWVFRYERNGVERWLGLGPCSIFTLQNARDKARKALQLLWDGFDPITVMQGQRAENAKAAAGAKTFAEAASAFYDANHMKWNSKRYQLAFHQRMEAHVYPKLGKLPVSAIDKPIIIDALRPIWNDKQCHRRPRSWAHRISIKFCNRQRLAVRTQSGAVAR